MSKTLKPYLDSIRAAIEKSLDLRDFPSPVYEGQNRPEVEVPSSQESILEPISIVRSDYEKCYIEPSMNSTRISFLFKSSKSSDHIEQLLGKTFLGFLMKRAEDYIIMRRVPVKGYSLSFLICTKHIIIHTDTDSDANTNRNKNNNNNNNTNKLSKEKIINFILYFVEEADKEISSLKIAMNARGRAIASEYMALYNS